MAGLGFDVQENSSFKNKQSKQPTAAEVIAGSQVAQNLANSPAASAIGSLVKSAAAGIAAAPAAAMDVSNKAGNVVNYALGGDPNYFSTNNTSRVLNSASPGSPSTSVAVPSASATSMVPQMAVSVVPQAVTPPAAPALAGGIQKSVGSFGEAKFSDGSGGFAMNEQNRLANVAQQNESEARYKAYLDKAAAGPDRTMGPRQITAKDQFDMSFIGKANESNPLYKNAMLTRKVWEQNNANDQADIKNGQALKIAGMGVDAKKYVADQGLTGHQVAADANVKAAQIGADAGVVRAQQEAKRKTALQQDKDKSALQQKVYDQTINGYDWSGINPTAAHDFATTMAKTTGKGYATISDPTGTHGDAVIHPALAEFANTQMKAIKNPDQYVRLLQELDKSAKGGVHRTSIKNISQLKRLKVSPNQIAGMQAEQG